MGRACWIGQKLQDNSKLLEIEISKTALLQELLVSKIVYTTLLLPILSFKINTACYSFKELYKEPTKPGTRKDHKTWSKFGNKTLRKLIKKNQLLTGKSS